MSRPAEQFVSVIREYRPDRAVIDIGSNTVRLVVYAGSQRAPETWLNENLSARLGRDLSATGHMPDRAIEAIEFMAAPSAVIGAAPRGLSSAP